jgi:hypothetical protein
MKTILITLAIFLTTCQPVKRNIDLHTHFTIIQPLSAEIDGMNIRVEIDKCPEFLGTWKLVLDGQTVAGGNTNRTAWPYYYDWQTNYNGEHLLELYAYEGDNQQVSYVRVYN